MQRGPGSGRARDPLTAELRALRLTLLQRVVSRQTIVREGLLDVPAEEAYRTALALRRRATRRAERWPRWAERARVERGTGPRRGRGPGSERGAEVVRERGTEAVRERGAEAVSERDAVPGTRVALAVFVLDFIVLIGWWIWAS